MTQPQAPLGRGSLVRINWQAETKVHGKVGTVTSVKYSNKKEWILEVRDDAGFTWAIPYQRVTVLEHKEAEVAKTGPKEQEAAAARQQRASAKPKKAKEYAQAGKNLQKGTRGAPPGAVTIQVLQEELNIDGQRLRDHVRALRGGEGAARGERYVWPSRNDPEVQELITWAKGIKGGGAREKTA